MSGVVPPRHLSALVFPVLLYVLCGVVYSFSSVAHSRLEQVLIHALRMPIQKIKSSNLAPDNGHPNLEILGVSTSGKPLGFRTFQQAVGAALLHGGQ